MEKRYKYIIKLHALQRYIVWHHLQPVINNIRIAEFPRSGGTWLSQMIGDIAGIDFPRNVRLPMHRCVQHAHYMGPTNYNTIVLVRDGRDVLTSAYFHFLFHKEGKPKFLTDYWRSLMSNHEIENAITSMPQFIKLFSANFKAGNVNVNWSNHVLSYDFKKPNIYLIKYEDLLIDAKCELEKLTDWCKFKPVKSISETVKKYDFKNLSKRNPGEEDHTHFLRKGIAGDWKNYFNKESIDIFNTLHLDGLKHCKYD